MGLELVFETDGELSKSDVRSSLRGLSDDELTKTSPVTEGGSELAVVVTGGSVTVREEGHDGEWSKTSETAVRRAVQSVDGVGELVSQTGGYAADDEE